MPYLYSYENKLFRSNVSKQAVKSKNTHIAYDLCSSAGSKRFTRVIPANPMFLFLRNPY